jgi:hypothetical protein
VSRWRLAVALALVAAGVFAVREARQQAAERPPDSPPPPPVVGPDAPAAAAHTPRFTRDPFRYVERVREPPAAARAEHREAAPEATPTPEPAVRLSGFVRSGGALRAVLVRGSVVAVVAAGDSVDGYRVLSVDEDAGVRVKTPTGEELLLPPKGR